MSDDEQTISESAPAVTGKSRETPSQIGKYKVESALGRGGMGEVWLAHNPDLDIQVAIKTLPTHLMDEHPVYVERFVKEARTAARLTHANVVMTYDAGEDEGTHYIVMEYVEGGNARELLHEHRGPVPVDLATHIVLGVARGLTAAARFNIIHRDIKPENIMLDADGTPKLADLGLAKRTEGLDQQSMTGTGISVGTPAYIAPEQAQDSKSADARADIYSLGATLYHLCVGEPPYSGTNAFTVMMKHVNEPVPDIKKAAPKLPDDLCAIIGKMLDKDPAARFQSAAELVEALQQFRECHGMVTCFEESSANSWRQPQTKAPLPRRYAAFAIDSLLVLLLIGFLRGDAGAFWILMILYAGTAVGWRQRTIGKRLLGLRVVRDDGERLGFGVAYLRALGYIVSLLPLAIGFLWPIWDRDRAAFHDKICGTMVVRD